MTVRAKTRVCNECGYAMAISRRCCPHCGRPSHFPNVDLANQRGERNKLKSRYESALDLCEANGASAVVSDFENACKTSKAVFSLQVQKLHREIASGSDIFETYYDLERLKNRTEDSFGLDWSRLRTQAEIELLGDDHNVEQLHYACLSIEGVALNYGDCIVTLASSMAAHRVSCFEGNTAVLYHQNRNFDAQLRSNWDNRHEICVAMFAGDILSGATRVDFPTILVQKGKTPLEDRFVEVHLFGPITVRTFEHVHIDRSKHNTRESVFAEAIADKLRASGVEVT